MIELEIRYEQGIVGSYESMRCCALAYKDGKFLTSAYGETWNEAKAKVLAQAKEIIGYGTPPQPEKVVI